MTSKTLAVFGVLAVGIIAASLYFGTKIQTAPQPPLGAASNDFFVPVSMSAGQVNSGLISTSSQGDVTLTAAQLRQWVNSSLVSFSPGLLAGTAITLPASSTIRDIVPRPGDRQTFCMQNATSTLNVAVSFTSGLGTKLAVASSSATAVGSTKLFTGKVGCFTLIREVATSTAYDIDVLFTAFQ